MQAKLSSLRLAASITNPTTQHVPVSQESHAAKNKRNDLRKIDNENARLYVQLSKQPCSVFSVDKLKAEYSKVQKMKQRISLSKRAKAGIHIPKSMDILSMRSTSKVNPIGGTSLYGTSEGEKMTFQQLRDSYYVNANHGVGQNNASTSKQQSPEVLNSRSNSVENQRTAEIQIVNVQEHARHRNSVGLTHEQPNFESRIAKQNCNSQDQNSQERTESQVSSPKNKMESLIHA